MSAIQIVTTVINTATTHMARSTARVKLDGVWIPMDTLAMVCACAYRLNYECCL